MEWQPCPEYPAERIHQLFGGRTHMTLDRLRSLDVPAADKLWCLLHEEVIPAKRLHLLACDYAEQALMQEREAGREPDPRSWAAIDAKRRWIRGEASDAELLEARNAAWDAIWHTVVQAAREAALRAGWAASDVAWNARWRRAAGDAVAWQLERAFEAAQAAERGE